MATSEKINDLIQKMLEAESCFRRACRQILVLNRMVTDMQFRYDTALKQNARAFRYALRVRIAVLEGVRSMYFEYASMKADMIVELRKQVQQEHEDACAGLGLEDDEDEMSRDYMDEYDLSDSELEYSDIDFSDFDEDEAENDGVDLNLSVLVVNNVNSVNETCEIDKPGFDLVVPTAKQGQETDLNVNEISLDSGYLDESNIEEDP